MTESKTTMTGKRRGGPLGMIAKAMPYGTMDLPMMPMVMLSVLLILAAASLLLPVPPPDSKAPVFQGLRESNGEMFFADRMERAPVFYGWLHALPGAIWCVSIPLQFVRRLRTKYPAVHRWSGRASIFTSLVLSLTGLLMAPRKLSYTHLNVWHIHQLRIGSHGTGIPIMAWPTFEVSTTIIALLLVVTSYNTWYYARTRDYATHRLWAELCTVVGYTVPLQRAFMLVIALLGTITPVFTPAQRAFLRIPTDMPAKSDAERAAFAWTAFAAAVTSTAYIWHKNAHLQHKTTSAKVH